MEISKHPTYQEYILAAQGMHKSKNCDNDATT